VPVLKLSIDGSQQALVMIVDDTRENLQLLERLLREQGHRVLAFPSGQMALRGLARHVPDLMLLDITMPEMDGLELCRRIKQDARLADIPVLFISALSHTEDKVAGFAAGGVDYVTKPFQVEELHARVTTHLQVRRMQQQLKSQNQLLEGKVAQQLEEIAESRLATIVALARLTESRDDNTGGHIERTQRFCELLGAGLSQASLKDRVITVDFMQNLIHAAPLHDIGKVGIPDHILLKPGLLSAEEFEVMKGHSLIGARTLEEVNRQYPGNEFIHMGIAIARSHHEKWNGSGYPDGLSGRAIPLCARIMAVADTYDALRSDRPYKRGMDHSTCCQIIQEGSGSHFDPEIVDVFMNVHTDFAEAVEESKEDTE
jgi:putative two-component system response regulator